MTVHTVIVPTFTILLVYAQAMLIYGASYIYNASL